MKPIKGIWEQITSFENLYLAYKSAIKGRRYRDDVLIFTQNLEGNLFKLQKELRGGTYEVGNYKQFYISIPKKRLIMALPFRDRVVQWAIYRVIHPIFVKGYISDSYACITGRGVHSAISRVQYFLKLLHHKNTNPYVLKLDIRKYFYRIDHSVLLGILAKRLYDTPLLNLFKKIIKSKIPFGLKENQSIKDERIFGVGMPIGNLTSQTFANLYLNELDQYIKRKLQIRHYVRYMDDMIILDASKKVLHNYKSLIEDFLKCNLKLSLNSKTSIRPTTLGVDFCGYKIWNTHIKIRKSTALRIKRSVKKVWTDYLMGERHSENAKQCFSSYKGLFKHCDSYLLSQKIFTNEIQEFLNSNNTKGVN